MGRVGSKMPSKEAWCKSHADTDSVVCLEHSGSPGTAGVCRIAQRVTGARLRGHIWLGVETNPLDFILEATVSPVES